MRALVIRKLPLPLDDSEYLAPVQPKCVLKLLFALEALIVLRVFTCALILIVTQLIEATESRSTQMFSLY